MGVGQQNKCRVGFVIQARMKSSRFPNKVLMEMPLNDGKPLIKWITDTLKSSSFAGDIVVATSVNRENDILSEFCQNEGIRCYRGDEDDVLSRFINISEQGNYDVIVRLTADNPIIDNEVLDATVRYHLENSNDYTKTVGLPVGMNFEVVSSASLIDLRFKNLSVLDREHVTLFIRNSDFYKKSDFIPTINSALGQLRLTVDYPSDYLVVSTVLQLMGEIGGESKLDVIEQMSERYSWVFDVNRHNVQKKQPQNLTEELIMASQLLQKFDLKNAAQLLLEAK